MPTCAYCGNVGSMTKEHVTPRFVYKHLKINGKHLGWNRRIDTWKNNLENVTKDVCSDCNNGALAKLDEYAYEFFKENNLFEQRYIDRLSLRYDYNRLLRWLLKVSFNTSRMSALGILDHGNYLQYILKGAPQPNSKYFKLMVELLRPICLEDFPDLEEMESFVVKDKKYSNPFQFRLYTMQPTDDKAWVSRCIQIGGVHFHLLFIDPKIKAGYAAARIRKYLKTYENSIELSPNRAQCEVTTGNRTWMQALFSSPDFIDRIDAW